MCYICDKKIFRANHKIFFKTNRLQKGNKFQSKGLIMKHGKGKKDEHMHPNEVGVILNCIDYDLAVLGIVVDLSAWCTVGLGIQIFGSDRTSSFWIRNFRILNI